MLAVKQSHLQKPKNKPKKHDIFVTSYKTVITKKDGKTIIERKPKVTNITKYINESKKIIKKDQASDLLKQLNELMSKENK